jgi:methylenetetrahydrofolate dehydrogenase (NADP+) / methenyltetrahydrofolate cyclohydrolase
MSIIFDGYQLANKKEAELKKQVQLLAGRGIKLKIAAILFKEDLGSQLYTSLKHEAADRVGMDYEVFEFSMNGETEEAKQQIEKLNQDVTVIGIIVQKPWRQIWQKVTGVGESQKFFEDGNKKSFSFKDWWQQLVQTIDISKDVDGLHPDTLAAIKDGTWQEQGRVLPATCQAVLEILEQAGVLAPKKVGGQASIPRFTIIGRSDLLGKPLYFELKNRGYQAELLGKKELQARVDRKSYLKETDVLVSATGVNKLITAEMIKDGAVVIDVGEPMPDVDFESVKQKASFITPVPGGVGPMTVVSLLANCVLISKV